MQKNSLLGAPLWAQIIQLPAKLAVALGLALSLAACAPGEVELNGKLFDALGVNTSSTRAATPQMTARTPLVVPPSLERLPAPGKPVDDQAAVLAAINDPDRAKVVDKAQLEAEHAKVCSETYEPAKARGDPDADLITGPLGPCRKSILSVFGGAGAVLGTQ
ncbi:MAG: hypothetical protein AAFV45_01230 [Pseudomonadota bacterium]